MKQVVYIFCLAFLVFGCSKSSNGTDPNGENPDDGNGNEETISGVKLYFPQENMLCNEGTNLTPTESTVYFEWRANGADNYIITIENLSTGNVIQRETNEDIIPITIQRATAYKWFVESVLGSTTEQSDTWQFYNAGPGAQSYAPFPAEIVSPSMAESLPITNIVTLQWTASDVDDDIAGFDVYFGTNETASDVHASNINTTEATVSVVSGTIYYWKIITKDALGNTSDSGVFQFRVQ